MFTVSVREIEQKKEDAVVCEKNADLSAINFHLRKNKISQRQKKI